jgi:hypothetical protein
LFKAGTVLNAHEMEIADVYVERKCCEILAKATDVVFLYNYRSCKRPSVIKDRCSNFESLKRIK